MIGGMQTDAYTKTVLTIIAAGVLFIAFRDVPVISNAQAQEVRPLRKPSMDVNIVSVAGQPIGNGVPVMVMNR
jgi:hypothetical protein